MLEICLVTPLSPTHTVCILFWSGSVGCCPEGVVALSELDLIAFGERLRELRTAAGLSVRELADEVGISSSYLRVLETGENPKTKKPSRPSIQLVENLARAVNDDDGSLRTLAGRRGETDGGTEDEAREIRPRPRPEPSRPKSAGNAADLVSSVRASTRHLTKRSPFMINRAVDRLRQFDKEFRLLARGTLRCASEDEPYLTQLAVQSCKAHLRAVSFEDQAWWLSPDGERYRDVHARALRDNSDLAVTRIFLVVPAERAALVPTFRWHLELGITTYVLDLPDVAERWREDYVLYDDTLLRTAFQVSEDRKEAEFTDDRARVDMQLGEFEDLRERAIYARALLTEGALAEVVTA